MKQTIRFNTFETNSSSEHTLVILDKAVFEMFKKGTVYYEPRYGFKDLLSITKTEDFIKEYPTYNDLSDDAKKLALDTYVKDYFDGDYACGYTEKYLNYQSEEVYDKDGNEKVAVSVYIGDC